MSKVWIIDELAYICKKKAMKYASQDYKANAYGASYVRQFLEKGKRDKDKAANNPDNVEVGCEKGKPCAATDGGDGPTRQSNEGSGSTGGNKGAKGEKNEVMSKKDAEKWGNKLKKDRQNAPKMNKLTKNQQKALLNRPSREDIKTN